MLEKSHIGSHMQYRLFLQFSILHPTSTSLPFFLSFAHIYILHKDRPIPLKREKPPDTFLAQAGQGLYY